MFLAVHLVDSVQVSRVNWSSRGAFMFQGAHFLAYLISQCKIHQV